MLMHALILAGGSGTRLWPLSTHNEPKQFLQLFEDASLLQGAVKRAQLVAEPSHIFIATNPEGSGMIGRQIEHVGIPAENVFKEPVGKNTAPAIALAFKRILEAHPELEQQPFFICPSDHWIEEDSSKWKELLSKGAVWAKKGKIAAFGIVPVAPEVGYGYIKTDAAFHIKAFKEKPDQATAAAYLKEGGYFWNSGLYIITPYLFFEELEHHAPELARYFKKPLKEILEGFSTLVPQSIDYAIMEKTQNGVLVPLTLGWSDIGSWESLYRGFQKDSQQNASQGNVRLQDVARSFVLSNGKPLMAVGVSDLLIVQTQTATLVAKRGISDEKMRTLAKQAGYEADLELGHTFHRPWGSYTVLARSPKSLTKRIVVLPHKRTSLQFHRHRDEHWVVVQGIAEVTLGESTTVHEQNSSLFIPKETVHRIANPGDTLLEIIEVQYGDVLKEGDIERISDDFGRVHEPA